MEEEQQELRFVCKLCDKRYPSGKSLGGHMRSHVIAPTAPIANSAESEDQRFVESPNMMMFKKGSLNGNGVNGNANPNPNPNSNYGLRENPKKTWRAVDSTFPFPHEKVCKQCGKGFQSLKALCGHMACHSDKDKGLKDYDYSWTSENQENDDDEEEEEEDDEDDQEDPDDDDEDVDGEEEEKVVMDSHSDTEADDPTRVTRSKTKRYKKITNPPPHPPNYKHCSSFTALTTTTTATGTTNNNNYNYGSSSVSEIDHEQEQEEVAMCLMMLSKDSGNWVGVNSVVESSDNNSVVLETKSSSIDMIIGRKEWNHHNRVRNGNGEERKREGKKLKYTSSGVDDESVQFENYSNSGYNRSRDGMRKVESEISVDELLRNYDEFDDSNLEMYDKKYGRPDLRKNLVYGDSKKREYSNPQKKKEEYPCETCHKVFSSFQGLGGHRPCNKKMINASSSVPKYGSGENRISPDSKVQKKHNLVDKKVRVKKGKGHECPICFRVFKSGQALGGHKRSHFLNNGSDHRIDHMAIVEKEVPEFSDLIDLNLPAPEED